MCRSLDIWEFAWGDNNRPALMTLVHVPSCWPTTDIMDTISPDRDPFIDPINPEPPQRSQEESTLIVGRTASLTLATDSLVVLGEYFSQGPVTSTDTLLARRSVCAEEAVELLWLRTER